MAEGPSDLSAPGWPIIISRPAFARDQVKRRAPVDVDCAARTRRGNAQSMADRRYPPGRIASSLWQRAWGYVPRIAGNSPDTYGRSILYDGIHCNLRIASLELFKTAVARTHEPRPL